MNRFTEITRDEFSVKQEYIGGDAGAYYLGVFYKENGITWFKFTDSFTYNCYKCLAQEVLSIYNNIVDLEDLYLGGKYLDRGYNTQQMIPFTEMEFNIENFHFTYKELNKLIKTLNG